MQVSVESTGNIDRKMTVEVPAERIDSEVTNRLKNLRSRVRLDGFRPGKVPMSVVQQRYSASVHQEVVGDVVDKTFREAAVQEALKIAGRPDIHLDAMELGKPLSYIAEFQVYPEVALADMTKLELVKQQSQVDDADVEGMVETLRKQHKTWKDVKRAAKEEDQVTLDFAGTLDGEPFEGGTSEGFSVELGQGRMLPDFEAALIGMKAGDEKMADVSFPENYQAENLAGKTAQFELKVSNVAKAELPKVDEDFVKQFGVDSGSLDDLKVELRTNMERELENALKQKLKQSVMDGLADLHEIDLPKALVVQEIEQVKAEFSQNVGRPVADIPDDIALPQAEKRVKLGLVVGEVIRSNGIKRDEDKINNILENLAASYEKPSELKEYYQSNPQAMQSLEAAAMEEQVIEWAVSNASVSEEHVSFQSVMNPEAPAAGA